MKHVSDLNRVVASFTVVLWVLLLLIVAAKHTFLQTSRLSRAIIILVSYRLFELKLIDRPRRGTACTR